MTRHESLATLEKLKADRRAEVRRLEEARARAEREAAEQVRIDLEDAAGTYLREAAPGGEALLAFAADWGKDEYAREPRLHYRKVTFRVPGHADVTLYLAYSEKLDAWLPANDVDGDWPTWNVDGRGSFDALADALIAAEASGDPPF